MKQIISFFLRIVPRKYLQLFSHHVLKLLSFFYKGNNVECPICESHFRKFLPYGRVGRSNALCPNCLSLERHRLIWVYLTRETEFFTKNAKMLHIAPEICFIDRFNALANLDYTSGDIESPLAKVKMDIHQIPFDENTFDIIFCNHVLEHVEDDELAMRELFRVLKPGGWAILQIPLFYPLPDSTLQDPTISDPKERERLFGQDDHVRKYGMDYIDRLNNAGFNVESDYINNLEESIITKYALAKDDILFLARK